MPSLPEQDFARRAGEIEWLLSDVDGVLTDAGLYYDRRGASLLRFNAKDGLGIKLAQMAGLKFGLLTGRDAPAVEHRASELGMDAVLKGVVDKAAGLDRFLEEQQTSARRVAFIGDDLPDLVVLARCGLTFAPADAVPEVRTVVHRVLEARGGEGAVREMIEVVLKARGAWDEVFRRFTFDV